MCMQLRKLYDLRRTNPGLISAKDICAVVRASMVMPKEEHNLWLTELVAKAEAQKVTASDKVRLVLTGNLCDKPHENVLDLIEALGAVIVADDMYVGARYFATDVAQKGDPIEALANHFITRIPCTTMHYPELFEKTETEPQQDYAHYLIDMFKGSNAQGVIVLMLLYCDPYSFKYPYFSQKLSAAEVPFIMIETEHEMSSLEPIRTRVQAFLEMVRG